MRVWLASFIICCCGLASASTAPPKVHSQSEASGSVSKQNPSAPPQSAEDCIKGSTQSPLVVSIQESRDQALSDRIDRSERSKVQVDARRIGWGTIIVLLVQIVVFLWQGWQLRSTVTTMRNIADDEKRPWLIVSLNNNPPAGMVLPAIRLHEAGGKLGANINLAVKNIGKSPAFHITDVVELSTADTVNTDFPQLIAKFAPIVKQQIRHNNHKNMLFPSDSKGQFISNSQFDVPIVGNKRHVTCGVSYTSASNPERIYTTLIMVWVNESSPTTFVRYDTYAD